MEKDSELSKIVPGLSPKPFYLESPKGNIRLLVVLGLMLLVLGLANPILLAPFFIYLVYAFIKIRGYKSEVNIQLGNAIDSFIRKDMDKTILLLQEVLAMQPDNRKAKGMWAIIEYEKGNYRKAIDLIITIPEKYIREDFDLTLKLADSYLKENMLKEAKNIYEKLLRIFPNSLYIKDIINKLKERQ